MIPWLQRSHPGYFYVALAILGTHISLALDALQPGRHTAPVFRYVRPDIVYYGYMHIVVAAAIIAAFYLPVRFWWIARMSFFISILTFNTFSVGEVLGAVLDHGVSWIGPTGLIAMSISSAAAWREPVEGPRFRTTKPPV